MLSLGWLTRNQMLWRIKSIWEIELWQLSSVRNWFWQLIISEPSIRTTRTTFRRACSLTSTKDFGITSSCPTADIKEKSATSSPSQTPQLMATSIMFFTLLLNTSLYTLELTVFSQAGQENTRRSSLGQVSEPILTQRNQMLNTIIRNISKIKLRIPWHGSWRLTTKPFNNRRMIQMRRM